MDELKRLEREVRDLQAQLRRQTEEAERARRDLIADQKHKLEACQAEMQRAVRDHDSAAKARYETLLQEYQHSLTADVQQELSRVNADYDRLLKDTKRKEALLKEKSRELEQAVETLRQNAAARDEGSSRDARVCLENATAAYRTVSRKPHEKFMPHRLDVLSGALDEGRQLFHSGLYEAAAAVAISARSGMERLGYAVDDKAEEWERQFTLFSLRLDYLHEKLRQEIADWAAFAQLPPGERGQERVRRVIEIDFWSRGVMGEVMQTEKAARRILNEYSQSGRDDYLKRPESPSVEELARLTETLVTADKRLTDVSGLYKQRYAAACERADWGESLIDFLTEEINLVWVEGMSGFQPADSETLASPAFRDYTMNCFPRADIREDVRGRLRLVFDSTGDARIFVYLVPEESGATVTNRVILHIDYAGAEDAAYTRDMLSHVCEAIGAEEGDGTVRYASDAAQLKTSTNPVLRDTGKDLERKLMNKE